MQARTDLRVLEKTGFVYLYGLAPVVNAMVARRRDFADTDVLVEELLGDDGGKWGERGFEDMNSKGKSLTETLVFWQERQGDGGDGGRTFRGKGSESGGMCRGRLRGWRRRWGC